MPFKYDPVKNSGQNNQSDFVFVFDIPIIIAINLCCGYQTQIVTLSEFYPEPSSIFSVKVNFIFL